MSNAELEVHQQRVVDRLLEEGVPGLAVAHTMGSGKTLTALSSVAEYKSRNGNVNAIAVVPASLVTNMWKEVSKHELDITPDDLKVISYHELARNPDRYLNSTWDILISDEAHNARNTDTKKSQFIRKLAELSTKVLPLSGTFSYNRPEDIGVVLRLASRDKNVPMGQEFKKEFIEEIKQKPGLWASIRGVKPGVTYDLKNVKALEKLIGDYVDYHDARESSQEYFPEVSRSTLQVQMSPEQAKMYRYVEGSIPTPQRLKMRMGLAPSKAESKALNAYLSGVRQVANTPASFYKKEDEALTFTPKVNLAVEEIKNRLEKDENFRSVIYSNYLDSGINPVARKLEQEGISAATFHGGLNKKQKKEIIDRYNEGDIKTLLLSSSGAEGLDLKGTKLMQILEPHFNKSKIEQVIARGDRYKSHTHLPEEERKMEVQYLQSILPKSFFGLGKRPMAVDEYLHNLAEDKDALNQKLVDIMKRTTRA